MGLAPIGINDRSALLFLSTLHITNVVDEEFRSMAVSDSTPSLLGLPIELRFQIIEYMLAPYDLRSGLSPILL